MRGIYYLSIPRLREPLDQKAGLSPHYFRFLRLIHLVPLSRGNLMATKKATTTKELPERKRHDNYRFNLLIAYNGSLLPLYSLSFKVRCNLTNIYFFSLIK